MADRKSLPEGLDPDVVDLVEQLRRLKDRSGMSLAALAERTLHSKSSWERYLNGKALPPRRAVAALASVTGADAARLDALWDLAERAWSGRDAPEGPRPAEPDRGAPEPHRPTQQPDPQTPGPGRGDPGSERQAPRRGHRPPEGGRRSPAPLLGALHKPSRAAVRWSAALAVALLLTVGTVALVTRSSSDRSPSRSVADHGAMSQPTTQQLDTRCFADSCTGQDPSDAGCAGDAWTAALTRADGVYVELRYSDSCKAAWARISWGDVGDVARVVAAKGATRQNKVHYDTDVYSPMVAADAPSDARACTLLVSGARGCTGPGGTQRLTEPPEPPVSATPPRRGR
ncbi:DUF2690 domain-containing protein [Streptomyces sp. NPDC002004]